MVAPEPRGGGGGEGRLRGATCLVRLARGKVIWNTETRIKGRRYGNNVFACLPSTECRDLKDVERKAGIMGVNGQG